VLPGIVAGALSTLALGALARLVGKHPAAPVSAVSHWVWPQEVNQTARPRTRHFMTGLAIHHLMSIGWAAVNAFTLAAIQESREPCSDSPSEYLERIALAGAMTLAAAFSDYVVVPKRFTPGFEFHLRVPQIAAVYVAFGAGLVAPFVLKDLCRRRPRAQ
jgi:putative flippase GtrA